MTTFAQTSLLFILLLLTASCSWPGFYRMFRSTDPSVLHSVWTSVACVVFISTTMVAFSKVGTSGLPVVAAGLVLGFELNDRLGWPRTQTSIAILGLILSVMVVSH